MNQAVLISPSILAANPLSIEKEIKDIEKFGIDYHHVDVMDGHFVPNLTFGLPLVAALKKQASVPLDVHIMVTNPDEVACEYVRAGAAVLTFHVEAARHHHRLIKSIQDLGAQAGIAINPGTSLALLEPLIPYVDVINVMTVNPGFGGQSFIAESPARIACLKKMIDETCPSNKAKPLIQVDGGITPANIRMVVEQGAQFIVAGSAIYAASDRGSVIEALRCK